MSLTIGIVYEGFDAYPRAADDPEDHAVEYEPESTVEVIEAAFERLGHRSERIGTPHALMQRVVAQDLGSIDAVFSIAEGRGPRTREGWALALVEMAGLPYFGSDALTLSLSLDKAWTNCTVAAAGIRIAPQCVLSDASEAREAELPAAFPLFVKPRWEGTSKGIRASSRVEDRDALVREVERVTSEYRQPALVEAFVGGAEYTVSVVGHRPARALPVLQRALDRETGIGLHAIDGVHDELRAPDAPAGEHELPGKLTPDLEAELQQSALAVFGLFECRDFARVDFRLDAPGRPVFLELNPLPTFAVDGSFGVQAELEGREPAALLAEVFAEALVRLSSENKHLERSSS
ncbi:MAG: D-alanine--D-alanine ligase [Myxococcota bacterium]|jgi:D-alanine-D-alanine ligase|nr:D-alanine--D-alanine ligase [Myxococcota bacterium]